MYRYKQLIGLVLILSRLVFCVIMKYKNGLKCPKGNFIKQKPDGHIKLLNTVYISHQNEE